MNLKVHKNFPLLKKLMFLQVVVLIFGLIVSFFAYDISVKNQIKNAISLQKTKVLNSINFQKDKIWGYKVLNLKKALKTTLSDLKKKHRLKSLKFLKKDTLIKKDHFQIIIKDPSFKEHILEAKLYPLDLKARKDFKELLGFVLVVCFIYCFVILFSLIFIGKNFYRPLMNLMIYLNENKNKFNNIKNIPASGEVKYFLNFVTKSYKEKMETERQQGLIDMAHQVAHDIRSPLTVLEMSLNDTKRLPQESHFLVKNSLQNIKDIANNLLEKRRIERKSTKEMERFLLIDLLENIISEKRFQFKNHKNLEIDGKFDPKAYSCFLEMIPSDLRIVLSNIINNSIEAMDKEKSYIQINLNIKDNMANITIKDNGKGIKKEHLEDLFLKGATFNKKEGNGLGLYHAKKTIENVGGTLNFHSEENLGTTFTILIPTVSPGLWFSKHIKIPTGHNVIVLDDDKNIHSLWENRFKKIGIQVYGFTSFSSMKEFILKNEEKSFFYLFDYEIHGDKLNGLQAIIKEKLQEKSVIVTSHYSDEKLQSKSLKEGIQILPKKTIPFVEIHVIEEDYDLIHIEDDRYLRMSWIMEAKKKGKKILSLEKCEDLRPHLKYISNELHIYLDKDLGSHLIAGDEFGKQLYSQGFKNIFLTTGHRKQDLPDMPWFKAILSKRPPF